VASKQLELKADKRELIGKKVKQLRQQGLIPAVIYGRKLKPIALAVDFKEFRKKILKSEHGLNQIFSLKLGQDKSIHAITQSLQKDALTDNILHIDFKQVVMDEKMKTKVPVELTGIAIGVKEEEGVLVHGLRELEVRCLPGDIPDKFVVDVTKLKINESIHVSDLKVSDKVEVLAEPSEMVATVSPPTKEEEIAPAVPVFGEGEEGAVPLAEGAAPAAAGVEAGKEGAKEGAPAAAAGRAPSGAPAGKEKPAKEAKK
jgi:large subunit ribosomal protein L25